MQKTNTTTAPETSLVSRFINSKAEKKQLIATIRTTIQDLPSDDRLVISIWAIYNKSHRQQAHGFNLFQLLTPDEKKVMDKTMLLIHKYKATTTKSTLDGNALGDTLSDPISEEIQQLLL